MGEEGDGDLESGQGVQDRGQAYRIVGVVGAVDRCHHEPPRRLPHGGRQVGGQRVVGHRVAYAETHVCHHVTDEAGPGGEALPSQVTEGILRRGEQQVGGVVGEDAVVLLGHRPVERAQARLEVGEREPQLDRGEGGRDGGVGVAVDEHPVGGQFGEHRVEGGQHPAGLHAVATRADGQLDVGRRDRQVGEEDLRHPGVVVLTGVDDHVRVSGLGERRRDRRQLDELGPCTDHAHHLHGRYPSQRLTPRISFVRRRFSCRPVHP